MMTLPRPVSCSSPAPLIVLLLLRALARSCGVRSLTPAQTLRKGRCRGRGRATRLSRVGRRPGPWPPPRAVACAAGAPGAVAYVRAVAVAAAGL